MGKIKQIAKNALEHKWNFLPAVVSLSGCIAIALGWNVIAAELGLDSLGIVERLAFGAAMSWAIFLGMELVKEGRNVFTLNSQNQEWKEKIAAEERAKTMEFLAFERAKDREVIVANQETILANQEIIRELIRRMPEPRGESGEGA